MFIETTLHLHADTMKRISEASRLAGQSKNYIVSRLLCMITDEKKAGPAAWSRIRYQDRYQNIKWHRMHVLLSPAEYELFLDLRKVYKMSVSRIIALEVEKYMDGLVEGLDNNPDNYRFPCYVFSKFIIDGVICWAQYWGLPHNLHVLSDSRLPDKNQILARGS
jgi:hypothetical protein